MCGNLTFLDRYVHRSSMLLFVVVLCCWSCGSDLGSRRKMQLEETGALTPLWSAQSRVCQSSVCHRVPMTEALWVCPLFNMSTQTFNVAYAL